MFNVFGSHGSTGTCDDDLFVHGSAFNGFVIQELSPTSSEPLELAGNTGILLIIGGTFWSHPSTDVFNDGDFVRELQSLEDDPNPIVFSSFNPESAIE